MEVVIHCTPSRKFAGQLPPLATGLQDIEDGVQHLAQAQCSGSTDRRQGEKGLQTTPGPFTQIARIPLLPFFCVMLSFVLGEIAIDSIIKISFQTASNRAAANTSTAASHAPPPTGLSRAAHEVGSRHSSSVHMSQKDLTDLPNLSALAGCQPSRGTHPAYMYRRAHGKRGYWAVSGRTLGNLESAFVNGRAGPT